jgi:hypothetical protein
VLELKVKRKIAAMIEKTREEDRRKMEEGSGEVKRVKQKMEREREKQVMKEMVER